MAKVTLFAYPFHINAASYNLSLDILYSLPSLEFVRLILATNICWSDSFLLVGCMVGPYLARPRRHSSSDHFLDKFGLMRVGPEVLLATHFLLGRGWTLYGAQGPLFYLGILPLQ